MKDKLIVIPFIGTIRQRLTWVYPIYHICDSLGAPLLKIRGPSSLEGLCLEDITFIVTTAKFTGLSPNQCVATITKKWSGWGCIVIDFERDSSSVILSMEEKAFIFSAAFLL